MSLHPLFAKILAAHGMPQDCCANPCDCAYEPINGFTTHAADCNSRRKCDDDGEGYMCEKHTDAQMRDYAYLKHTPRSAVFGERSEEEKQELKDAGRL